MICRKCILVPMLALVQVACSDTPGAPITPEPPRPPQGPFSYSSSLLWSSDTVRVTSQDFRDWEGEVKLTVGDVSLLLDRENDTTMYQVASGLPVGTYQSSIRLGEHFFQLPLVRVSGYEGAREFGSDARILWDAYITDVDGFPHVIGSTYDARLSMVNLMTGSARALSGIIDWERLRGPGITPTPGEWVMRSGSHLTTYRLSTVPELVEEYVDLGSAYTRQAAKLSEGTWMTTTSQTLLVRKRAGPGEPYLQTLFLMGMNEPAGIHLSVPADRATIRVYRVNLGVPVVEASSGTLAYRMGFVGVRGVDFTADGSSMLVLGDKEIVTDDLSTLEVLRSSDGEVLLSRPLPHYGFAATFDQDRNYIYVAVTMGVSGARRPGLMVLDAGDLSTVALLEIPETAPGCGSIGNCYGGVVSRLGEEVTIFHSWNGPPTQWRFSLKPD